MNFQEIQKQKNSGISAILYYNILWVFFLENTLKNHGKVMEIGNSKSV
jgi:hypothetical protein